MDFRISLLVLAFLLSSALGDIASQTRRYLQTLAEKSYDKNILPEGSDGPGTALKVKVSMFILDIHKIDDTNMDFKAHLYFRQSWNDSRLKYDMNVKALTLTTVENIWTPDLFFVEEREGSLHQVTQPNILLKINPNGEVLFSCRYSLVLSCPMDLRNYPHDIQTCEINIESYSHQRTQIELEWLHRDIKHGVSHNMTLLEFDLIETIPSAEQIEVLNGIYYGRLQVSLVFKRKFGFFATRLYVPFLILVLMASSSFWIRIRERYLRLALLLVTLYLMVSISTSMNNLTPPAPYTKGSDVWIGFCESLVFAAFLEFIVVALITGRESDDEDVKTKSEILLSLDPEDKENKQKSNLSKVFNMFDARRGGMQNSLALRIDKLCRLLFPLIFVIFNIIYWSVYCSH